MYEGLQDLSKYDQISGQARNNRVTRDMDMEMSLHLRMRVRFGALVREPESRLCIKAAHIVNC